MCFRNDILVYSEFKQDKDIVEFPLPSYNLTQGEIACLFSTSEDLGLECKVRGSVSEERILLQLDITYELQRGKNQQSAYAKTKTQISFAVTAKLISAFVFTTWIV